MSGYERLKRHAVSRLCHFTKLQSLTHILATADGIIASGSIRQDTKNVNDTARYDGELNHVCCTIEYPNSWFLNSAIKNNADEIFRDWVVLCIDLEVLLVRSAKFCECNASKAYGQFIQNDLENIDQIFADRVSSFPYLRTAKMLPCCPTNGQAEILIKDNIPRRYISKIIVGNVDIAKRVYAMQNIFDISEIPIYIAPDVLSPSWSAMIKQCVRPQEQPCLWTEEVES